MRRLTFVVMMLFAVLAINTTGCPNKKSGTATDTAGKGTDTKKTPTDEGGTGSSDKDKSFEFSANPAKNISIKQGSEQKVTVTVTRGKDFHEKVTVTLKSDQAKVTLDPAELTLDKDVKTNSFKIMAASDAPVAAFKITAHAKGGDKSHKMDIIGEVIKSGS